VASDAATALYKSAKGITLRHSWSASSLSD
jgi:hypothetical protein